MGGLALSAVLTLLGHPLGAPTVLGISLVSTTANYVISTGGVSGFALKAHNHNRVSAVSPRTRWINTWNAASNSYMVSVNERLGFEPREFWTGWQLDRSV